MPSDELLIASFSAACETAASKLGKALRARLRDRLPGLLELVYVRESRNSLVNSHSPTETGSQEGMRARGLPGPGAPVPHGGCPTAWVRPQQVAAGEGKAVRDVVLDSVADYECAESEALMAAAVKRANVRLGAGAQGGVVIKAAAQKE